MKEFNANTIFEWPTQLMQSVGIWPQTHYSFSYNLRGLLTFTFCTVGLILCLLQGVQDFKEGNYETGSYALCLVLVGSHAAFKIWYLLTNKSSFFDILLNLEDESLLYHHDEFDYDFQDKIQFSKKMFNTLVVVCINAGLSVAICEFALGYESNPRVIPIKADLNQPILYINVWLVFTGACILSALVIGVFEGLVLIFVSVAIAQLRILTKQIIRAVDCYPSELKLSEEDRQYYDRMVNHKLSKCVKRHNAIERYIASVETKFALGFLVQYCVTLGVTGLIGLNFIFATPASIDFFRCLFFFVADLAQVFVVYFHCNEIILESENIREACYFSNWTVCGPSVRKTLFILMERTKRPFFLTTGKFSIISLDTFVVVVKTSMSYFTVLKSMYGDFD